MVTDIDAYAPFIKAVFKNAPYAFSLPLLMKLMETATRW